MGLLGYSRARRRQLIALIAVLAALFLLAGAATAFADTYEPNEGDAYSISPGQTYTSFISHSADYDRFRFFVSAPGPISVEVTQPACTFNVVWLLDPRGYAVAQAGTSTDYALQPGAPLSIQFNAQLRGWYTVRIECPKNRLYQPAHIPDLFLTLAPIACQDHPYTLKVTGATITEPPATTSITIKTNLTSVTRPRPFILSGVLNGGAPGELVVVWVKKPGKSYYSYSSNRLCFGTVPGGTNWWYRYTPIGKTCPAGTYYFKASFPGSTAKEACVSPNIVSVRVR